MFEAKMITVLWEWMTKQKNRLASLSMFLAMTSFSILASQIAQLHSVGQFVFLIMLNCFKEEYASDSNRKLKKNRFMFQFLCI